MTSSDEEEEFVPDQVTRYYFADDNDNPISFAVLPFRWSDGQTTPFGGDEKVVLQGIAESGLQKVYKPVIAWKLELSEKNPIISVLTKEDKWIKLLKPRQSYEEMIRSAMIMVQALHFACKNPDASRKNLWEHLSKTFSLYEHEPSDDDLREHRPLIRELIKRHETLTKSKLGKLLVEDPPKRRKSSSGGLLYTSGWSTFIVDDADADDHNDEDLGKGDGDSDESDDEDDQFDSVCAFCDNGCEILCCEGSCLRSFHATLASGTESDCQTLEMSDAEVKATSTFFCQNCKDKKHQCFACGKLGSSDKRSNPEVFRCSNATCGRFYHPKCVAEVLYPGNETRALQCKEKIGAGTSFACPLHMCVVCRQWEGTGINDKELQFAVCRRCPMAYHRKCLPRKIAFEDDDEDENIIQRAWEGLLPNRILIYCLMHMIDENLGTPIRNHIVFPESVVENDKDVFPQSSTKRKSQQVLHESASEKIMLKKRKISSNDISPGKSSMGKPQRHVAEYSTVKGTAPSSTNSKNLTGSGVFFGTKSNFSMVTSRANSFCAMEKPRDSVTGKSFEQASMKRKALETSKAVILQTTDTSGTQFLVDSEVEKRPEQEDKMKNEAVNNISKVGDQGNASENVSVRINQVPARHVTDKTEKQAGRDGSEKACLSSGSMLSRSTSNERPSEALVSPRSDRFEVTESNSISKGHRSISQEKPSKAFKTTDNCEGKPQSICKERTSKLLRSPIDEREGGTRSMSISGEEPFEAIMSSRINRDHSVDRNQLANKSSLADTEDRSRVPLNNVMDDEFENIERRYSRINSSMFPKGTPDFQIYSHGYVNIREQECAHHNFPDRSHHSFRRENNDGVFQTGNLPKAPANIFGDRYVRPAFDVRQQSRMYGQHNPDDFAPHRGALDQDRPRLDNLYSSTAPRAATSGSSSYDPTASIIHRYAPHLDELNSSRQNVYPPANGPDRGNQTFGSMMDMGSRSGFQQDPMNYSYPYPRRSPSGGWIDD